MRKLLTIFFCVLVNFAHATIYYISATGSASNNGTTIATPWNVTKLNASWSSINGGDIISFNRGDVFTETLLPAKSGSNGLPITITYYGTGSAPLFSGSIVVSGWLSLGGNVYQSLSTVTPQSAINMVSFDGIPQRISRNKKFTDANKGYTTYTAVGGSRTAGQEAWIKTGTALGFNATGKRLNIRKRRWNIEQVICTRVSGDTLFYIQPATYPGIPGYGFFLESDSTFLTQNGEWYHSPYTGKLLIYSSVNPSTITVKASTVDFGFNMNSRSYFNITGINFEGFNKTAIIANNNNGSLYATSVTAINITDCELRNNGVQGIRMDNAANSTVLGTSVYDALGAGITIHNLRGSGVNGASVISCVVKRVAMFAGMEISGDAAGRAGITAMANSGVTIMYNIVDSCGYVGVEAQGSDVFVYGNVIGNCLSVRDDGGNLYTYVGTTVKVYTNRIFRKNIIFNALGAIPGTNGTESSARGIYTDEQSLNIIIDSNTLTKITSTALYGNSVKTLLVTENNVDSSTRCWQYNRFQNEYATTDLDIMGNCFRNYIAAYSNAQIDVPFLNANYSLALDSNLKIMGVIDNNYVTINTAAPFSFFTQTTGAQNYRSSTKTMAQWQSLGKETNTTVLTQNDWILYINPTGSDSTFTFGVGQTWEDMQGNEYTGDIIIERYYSKFLRLKSTVTPPLPSDSPQLIFLGYIIINAN